MARRYTPIEKHPIYNDAYDRFSMSSPILNGGSVTQPNSSTILWDKQNTQGQIVRLIGNDSGTYFKGSEQRQAEIPFLEKRLKELEVKFKEHCKERRRMGFTVPTEYPSDMLKQRLEYEAQLDVSQLEVKELKKRLSEILAKEQKIDEENLLAYGLRQFGQLRGGILVELDGQKIVENEDGNLMISNGIYAGMLVSDYRILAKRWFEECRENDQKELERIQQKCREIGRPVPSQLGARGPEIIDKAMLPAFPKEFKNYLKDEKS